MGKGIIFSLFVYPSFHLSTYLPTYPVPIISQESGLGWDHILENWQLESCLFLSTSVELF